MYAYMTPNWLIVITTLEGLYCHVASVFTVLRHYMTSQPRRQLVLQQNLVVSRLFKVRYEWTVPFIFIMWVPATTHFFRLRMEDTASRFGRQLWIYWISSRGQSIRGGPPSWRLDKGQTTRNCTKKLLQNIMQGLGHGNETLGSIKAGSSLTSSVTSSFSRSSMELVTYLR